MKRVFTLFLVAMMVLAGHALAEAFDVDQAVIDRFTDTWVADGYTAEIWYDEEEGGFVCDMVIQDSFAEYRECHYDEENDALVCENGIRFNATFTGDIADYKKDIISDSLTAVFRITDDKLTCEDSEGLVKGVTFLHLSDAEEADAKALYEGSSIFTHADVEEAFMLVEDEFSKWEGCEMHTIRYAGDACVNEDNLKWMSELGGKEYRDCIEIIIDFHSPVEGGGAWEADTEYTDYEWWLARTENSPWELLTWGY